ncbi:MAG: cyclic-di-AMP receptor [Chloroflexota bacterium]
MKKLMIVIVRDSEDQHVIQALVQKDYRVTRIASTGGFLRRGYVTLMMGVDRERVDAAVEILKEICGAPEPGQNRATIFVVDMPDFVQI